MAAEFIGYTIVISLKSPLGSTQQVQGIVADVVEQELVLKDGEQLPSPNATTNNSSVVLLWSGQRLPVYHIDSCAIADLEVVARQQNVLRVSENTQPAHQRTQNYVLPEKSAPGSFVDPAILSFTKPQLDTRKVSADSNPSQNVQPDTVSPVMIADSIKQSPVSVIYHENSFPSKRTTLSTAPPSMPATKSQKLRDRRDSTATATLTEPFDHMALNEKDTNLTGPTAKEPLSTRGTGRKNRRGVTRRAKDIGSHTIGGVNDTKDLGNPQTVVKKPPGKGKGWRQTPLVEEAPMARSDTKAKRPKHHSRKSFLEDTNGWATEDATDIQDLGEFDFEHNLSKFDKRRVFDDIQKDDTIADDDRLISFNRKPRPGTNGGRNLHYTENVLDAPDSKANTWKSEAGETEEDELLEEHYSSGRASRRDVSRRPLPSRKGTLLPTKSSATASPLNGSVSSFHASLRLASTNKPCTCVSPLQVLEIEQLCTSELGLTDEIFSENAGRGIAEAALTLPPDLPPTPTILFLIGSHKSGSRAIAAARHLRNRNVRVSICLLGGERENMLLESLKRQLDTYRKSGGWTVRWDEFQARLSSDAPPDLIVDALLGMHVTFSELRTDDQAIAFEMIRWANRSAIPILAVDVPSGLHASTGEITLVDSSPLIVHATFIACLAAPKSGLLAALATGDGRSHDWRLSVVDIGISNVAWRKYGTRRRHGVDFGKGWVVNLKFIGAGAGGLDGV
jgi:enhancer of mRNA-decapping protein 3